MTKEKKEKINPIATFEGKTLNLTKFNLEDDAKQKEILRNILTEIYGDNLKVTNKMIYKIIKVTLSVKDKYIYLPYNLKVSKEGFDLNFTVEKQRKLGAGWYIFSGWMFIFALIGATYAGIVYLSLANLDKDIDEDGIPDINLDINKDNKAEINIDTNNDNKPDVNIDYKGNRWAVFNIDLNNDNNPESNFVNNAKENKTCKLNCDSNGDGWPDYNMDMDGDGIADIDVDTDNDQEPDFNLDVNGDGQCDLFCDTDGDGICDYRCESPHAVGKPNGTSSETGNPNINHGSALLIIRYIDGETISVLDLVPDDQPLYGNDVRVTPKKTFTIENTSNYHLKYSIRWNISENTFTSDHFEYKMTVTNALNLSTGYKKVPKIEDNNPFLVKNVLIPPRTSQKYTVEFNLRGINKPQNEDKNRSFVGSFKLALDSSGNQKIEE